MSKSTIFRNAHSMVKDRCKFGDSSYKYWFGVFLKMEYRDIKRGTTAANFGSKNWTGD